MTCRLLQVSTVQEWADATLWLEARSRSDETVVKDVQTIITNVAENGDAALVEYVRKFDCPGFHPPIRMDPQEIARGAATVSVESREQIVRAAANIRAFHEAQVDRSWFVTRSDGTILGQKITPVDAVGLYVPGGKGGDTPLISSLLMNVIPAQVAGCGRIAIVTPPRADGSVNPYILAASHLLDLDEIYRVGSAWAIAALALGTDSIPRVDLIAGPGNIFVTTAKKLLQGRVGIDMIAGPSEIMIIADSSANPAWVAADMLSQAEHDTLASAICVTDDARLADAIHSELARQLVTLPRSGIAARSLEEWGCIAVVPRLGVAMAIANSVAPEHLELCIRDPWGALPQVRHAGSIFLGQNTPEAVGDYYAGPNHVLPTLGTARFSSGLSVSTFCKRSNVIAASRGFLRDSAEDIAGMARLEELEAHARAVEYRMSKKAGQSAAWQDRI